MHTYKFQINDGEVLEIVVGSGLYTQAAQAAFITHYVRDPENPPTHVNTIKIWVENLLPDYGPYEFAMVENEHTQIIAVQYDLYKFLQTQGLVHE